MKERPILFSAPMVRAILEGRKSQTRRVVKPQPPHRANLVRVEGGDAVLCDGDHPKHHACEEHEYRVKCPYGAPGDRLWVKEGHALDGGRVFYRAGHDEAAVSGPRVDVRWRSPIHMPRWASRILLEVTDVRVERLQAITEADAVAEGAEASPFPGPWWQGYKDFDGELIHQQATGEQPPDWMIEPKPMRSMKHLDRSAVDQFRALWFSINGLDSWDANPWVWAITFRRLEPRP